MTSSDPTRRWWLTPPRARRESVSVVLQRLSRPRWPAPCTTTYARFSGASRVGCPLGRECFLAFFLRSLRRSHQPIAYRRKRDPLRNMIRRRLRLGKNSLNGLVQNTVFVSYFVNLLRRGGGGGLSFNQPRLRFNQPRLRFNRPRLGFNRPRRYVEGASTGARGTATCATERSRTPPPPPTSSSSTPRPLRSTFTRSGGRR